MRPSLIQNKNSNFFSFHFFISGQPRRSRNSPRIRTSVGCCRQQKVERPRRSLGQSRSLGLERRQPELRIQRPADPSERHPDAAADSGAEAGRASTRSLRAQVVAG